MRRVHGPPVICGTPVGNHCSNLIPSMDAADGHGIIQFEIEMGKTINFFSYKYSFFFVSNRVQHFIIIMRGAFTLYVPNLAKGVGRAFWQSVTTCLRYTCNDTKITTFTEYCLQRVALSRNLLSCNMRVIRLTINKYTLISLVSVWTTGPVVEWRIKIQIRLQ